MKYLKALKLCIWFAKLKYPNAVAKAEYNMTIPLNTEDLSDMSAEDVTEWLVAMGYTLEFVASVFFLFMCVLGVFSELRDASINYASPSCRFG